jgi:hypothetical protein
MRRLICLMILPMFLTACNNLQNEGAAAAILDAAVPVSRDHAAALVGGDLDAMRATGLELITIVNCWPEGC